MSLYFEMYINFRLKKKLKGARGEPLFPIPLWSQYERVLTKSDRTNNIAEAAHRALYAVLNGNHPNLWSFINILKTTQNSRDMGLEHLLAGIKPDPKRIRFRQADERLFYLVSSFNENNNILEYLRGIQYNFDID